MRSSLDGKRQELRRPKRDGGQELSIATETRRRARASSWQAYLRTEREALQARRVTRRRGRGVAARAGGRRRRRGRPPR